MFRQRTDRRNQRKVSLIAPSGPTAFDFLQRWFQRSGDGRKGFAKIDHSRAGYRQVYCNTIWKGLGIRTLQRLPEVWSARGQASSPRGRPVWELVWTYQPLFFATGVSGARRASKWFCKKQSPVGRNSLSVLQYRLEGIGNQGGLQRLSEVWSARGQASSPRGRPVWELVWTYQPLFFATGVSGPRRASKWFCKNGRR